MKNEGLCWTESDYRQACSFAIGKEVIVQRYKTLFDGRKIVTGEKRAKVTARYPHVIAVRDKNGFVECYRYPDVVRENILKEVIG